MDDGYKERLNKEWRSLVHGCTEKTEVDVGRDWAYLIDDADDAWGRPDQKTFTTRAKATAAMTPSDYELTVREVEYHILVLQQGRDRHLLYLVDEFSWMPYDNV